MSNYRIELRDKNGIHLNRIDNVVNGVSWSWDRIGGCGEARFRVREDFDGALAGFFTEDAEVRIYIPNLAGTAELWYSGYIDKITPNIASGEYIDLLCLGYVNQLKRCIVREKTYYTEEISTIVRNIAEVYATGITNIVSAAANYEITDFTADQIYFNENAFDVISKLADIAGKREWGVDANKNLFFKRRDDSINHFFNIKQDFVSFQPVKDYNPIITKIYLDGAEGYKQTFLVTNRITTREEIISNSSITTESVGYQFARMYLKEKGAAKRSYTGKQVNRTTRLESTVPMGRAIVYTKIGIRLKYDVATQLYDSGLKYDGGNEALQIEKIKYDLTDTGVNATLYFGHVPPTISDELARLEYMINTERAMV